MRIGIVGAGVSGLVAAHVLSRKHDVQLFEANDRPGGHTHTHDVTVESGRYAVDSGFIVFNPQFYPGFCKLLDQLDVEAQPTRMSFSVRDEASGLEYCPSGFNALFCQRRNLVRPAFHRMVRDIMRFYREAPEVLERGEGEQSLEDYLEANRYSRWFMDYHIYPMAAALWSIPLGKVRRFPIRAIVHFFANHGMMQVKDRPQWMVVKGGSRTYVDRLLSRFSGQIHLGTPIAGVRRTDEGVALQTTDGQEAHFDQVILASHADQSLRMLRDATDLERDVLSDLPYQENETTLHTDESVLPRRRAAWAAWNYHLPHAESPHSTPTYHMNTLQGLTSPEQFCVTLNRPASELAPDSILASMTYHHPVPTEAAVRARTRHEEVSGSHRVHFAGAYWGHGFHEDGVQSALRVCRSFGEEL